MGEKKLFKNKNKNIYSSQTGPKQLGRPQCQHKRKTGFFQAIYEKPQGTETTEGQGRRRLLHSCMQYESQLEQTTKRPSLTGGDLRYLEISLCIYEDLALLTELRNPEHLFGLKFYLSPTVNYHFWFTHVCLMICCAPNPNRCFSVDEDVCVSLVQFDS